MTEEIKKDPLDNEILIFKLTVEQTNHALQIFGNAPYAVSAPLIGIFRAQGEPQFKVLLEAQKAKDESKETPAQ